MPCENGTRDGGILPVAKEHGIVLGARSESFINPCLPNPGKHATQPDTEPGGVLLGPRHPRDDLFGPFERSGLRRARRRDRLLTSHSYFDPIVLQRIRRRISPDLRGYQG